MVAVQPLIYCLNRKIKPKTHGSKSFQMKNKTSIDTEVEQKIQQHFRNQNSFEWEKLQSGYLVFRITSIQAQSQWKWNFCFQQFWLIWNNSTVDMDSIIYIQCPTEHCLCTSNCIFDHFYYTQRLTDAYCLWFVCIFVTLGMNLTFWN